MAKIIITKGRPYELSVTIKAPSQIVPLELTDTAEAVFYIIDKDKGDQILSVDMTRILPLENGEFLASLDIDQTILLPSELYSMEDGGLFKSTCRGHIAVTDTANTKPEFHHLDSLIPDIYVADLGTV